MGIKEDGLWTGSAVFLIMFFVVAIILGFYVKARTKDVTQAFDNMR